MSHITGRDELRRVATHLRQVDRKTKQGIRGRLTRPLPEFEQKVKEAAAADVPDRYGEVLVPALELKARVSGLKVTITATARGKREKRDVRSVNAGRLRHPLYGNRDHWYDTGVTPGFFSRSTDDFVDALRREIIAVIDEIIATI